MQDMLPGLRKPLETPPYSSPFAARSPQARYSRSAALSEAGGEGRGEERGREGRGEWREKEAGAFPRLV